MTVDENDGIFPLVAHSPDPGVEVGGTGRRGKDIPRIVGSSLDPGTGSGKNQSLGGRTVAGEFIMGFPVERVIVADLMTRCADDKVGHGALQFYPVTDIGNEPPFGGIVVDPGLRVISSRGIVTVTFVVIGIKLHGSAQSVEVILTGGSLGTVPCLLQGGQQHGSKDGDNGDNDQQFNQRER